MNLRSLTATLLPYYRRYTPAFIKALTPASAREKVAHKLYGNSFALPDSLDPKTSKELAKGVDALRAKDWPAVQNHWSNVLDALEDNEAIAGQARLNISVAKRLVDPAQLKLDIITYKQARSERRPDQPKIALYTAIVDHYDSIKLPEQLDPRIDYVLFTDTEIPGTGVWQVKPIPYHATDHTRTARYIKTHPHTLLPGYDLAVWLDANIMILGDIYQIIESFLKSEKLLAAIRHPARASLNDEFEACKNLNKETPEILEKQIEQYKAQSHLQEIVIESGFMMFNLTSEKTTKFLNYWWEQIEHYSKRDQLSFGYALLKAGLSFHALPLTSIRNHPDFAFLPHDLGKSPANLLTNHIK